MFSPKNLARKGLIFFFTHLYQPCVLGRCCLPLECAHCLPWPADRTTTNWLLTYSVIVLTQPMIGHVLGQQCDVHSGDPGWCYSAEDHQILFSHGSVSVMLVPHARGSEQSQESHSQVWWILQSHNWVEVCKVEDLRVIENGWVWRPVWTVSVSDSWHREGRRCYEYAAPHGYWLPCEVGAWVGAALASP